MSAAPATPIAPRHADDPCLPAAAVPLLSSFAVRHVAFRELALIRPASPAPQDQYRTRLDREFPDVLRACGMIFWTPEVSVPPAPALFLAVNTWDGVCAAVLDALAERLAAGVLPAVYVATVDDVMRAKGADARLASLVAPVGRPSMHGGLWEAFVLSPSGVLRGAGHDGLLLLHVAYGTPTPEAIFGEYRPAATRALLAALRREASPPAADAGVTGAPPPA